MLRRLHDAGFLPDRRLRSGLGCGLRAAATTTTTTRLDANIDWKLSDKLTLTSTTGCAKLDHIGITDWQLLGTESRPDDVESKVFYQEFQFNAGAVRRQGRSRHRRELLLRRCSGGAALRSTGAAPAPSIRRRRLRHAGTNADAGMFRSGDTDHGAEVRTRSAGSTAPPGTRRTSSTSPPARGSRTTRRSIEQTRFPTNGDAFVPAPGTTSTTVNADDSWTEVDWRGTLDYHFTEDLMAYATASKAYRAGQYSFTVLANVAGPAAERRLHQADPARRSHQLRAGPARHVLRRTAAPESRPCFFMKWSNRQARAPGQLRGRRPGRLPDRLPHQDRRFGRRRYLGLRVRYPVRGDGAASRSMAPSAITQGRREGSGREHRPEPVPGAALAELQPRCHVRAAARQPGNLGST